MLILIALSATILSLTLGPVAYAWAARFPTWRARVDLALPWIVAALAAVEMREMIADNGPLILVWLALGLVLPTGLEAVFRRWRRQLHMLTLVIAVGGLVAHGLADGLVLAETANRRSLLPAAIALHSLPVGMAIWWLVAPHFGRRPAAAIIALTAAATIAGVIADGWIAAGGHAHGMTALTAFVTGSLLHAVFGRYHLH